MAKSEKSAAHAPLPAACANLAPHAAHGSGARATTSGAAAPGESSTRTPRVVLKAPVRTVADALGDALGVEVGVPLKDDEATVQLVAFATEKLPTGHMKHAA